jgi:hypothetical protein
MLSRSALSGLPNSSHAIDNSQPFPIYGWLKLRWVAPTMDRGARSVSGRS